MAWISEESQKALDKVQDYEQRVSDMLADARRIVRPIVESEREGLKPGSDIFGIRFY